MSNSNFIVTLIYNIFCIIVWICTQIVFLPPPKGPPCIIKVPLFLFTLSTWFDIPLHIFDNLTDVLYQNTSFYKHLLLNYNTL